LAPEKSSMTAIFLIKDYTIFFFLLQVLRYPLSSMEGLSSFTSVLHGRQEDCLEM